MKKILAAFAAAILLLCGCAREYDDTDLQNRVTTLETKYGNLETQVRALMSATSPDVFVQKVEELIEDDKVVGVTVTYTNGSVVTFKISGAGNSSSSNLSVVKNAEGVLCWALDGEIIQVDGKDLTVYSYPDFSIENGHLYITVDGAKTDLGAVGGGTVGDAIFKDITVGEDSVILTLQDDSTIELPLAKAFRLLIDKKVFQVTATDPIEIPYSVQNATDQTEVDVFTDANFTSEVTPDKIIITPKVVTGGTALAYADSKVGLTSIVKLVFTTDEVVDEPDTFETTDGKADPDSGVDYIVEAVNGQTEVHAVSNVNFEVKPQVDWIKVISTKSQNYTITLAVDDNPSTTIRTGEVWIVKEGTDQILQTIVIAQKAKEVQKNYYTPAGWEKVLDISDYSINSTFIFDTPVSLNPSNVTLQWKFYSNKWNNHKFGDKDAEGHTLYCNRLGEFATADESSSVLFRFSNDGDADGQLCLNAGVLGVNQVQVSKDQKPYEWPTGEWVVLTVVSDGTSLSIYHDDTLVQSISTTPKTSWDFARFDISMTWDDGSSWPLSQAFNGYLAYARVWDRALGAGDIAATMCEVSDANDEGLLLNWEFKGEEDIYVGNSVNPTDNYGLDFTSCWDGNGNQKDNGDAARAAWTSIAGTALEGLCYTVGGGTTPDDPDEPEQPAENIKATYWGNADAAAWYKEFNRAIDLPEGYSMTIHFYYDEARQQRLGNFGSKDESPCNMLRFGEGGNNNQLEWMVDTGSDRQKIRSSVEAVPQQWNAVTLTAGADGYKMYINGTPAGSADVPYKSGVTFQAIEFANSWGDAYRSSFNGAIAYISLWSKQLSEAEVASNVFCEPSGAGLEAFWPMTEGEGTVFYDKTGNYDDIDLRYMTRCNDEVSYVDIDVSGSVEWREYPPIAGTVEPQEPQEPEDPEEPEEPAEKEYYTPAGWEKVLDISDYNINSTFIFDTPVSLNPSNVTLQWKFYSNKWNNHKFGDKDAEGHTLYCNRLGEFATADESSSVLFRFSNDGDADGQLCLNAGVLGVNQVQVSKDQKPYEWPTGEWVVLTVVSDGTSLSIYHDDTLVQSISTTPKTSWDFARFDISMTWDDGSSWPLSQAFNGYLAYARVWDRALGAGDIAATLCEVAGSDKEGLLLNWQFKGGEDIYVENSVNPTDNYGLDFTSCWDGNGNQKDNGDAARAAWTPFEGSTLPGLCYTVK